jgi:hypothetical protein
MMSVIVAAASRMLSGSGIAPARMDPKKNSMNSVRLPVFPFVFLVSRRTIKKPSSVSLI